MVHVAGHPGSDSPQEKANLAAMAARAAAYNLKNTPNRGTINPNSGRAAIDSALVKSNPNPVTSVTPRNFVRSTPASRAEQQRLQDIAFANAEFGVPTQTRVPTNLGQTGLTMGDLPSVAFDNPVAPTTSASTGPSTPTTPVTPVAPVTPVTPVTPAPPGPPSTTVDESIRGLFGELSTQDFTQQIKDLMAEREASLVGLNKQSLDQLAAGVALRTTQIGDISKALTESLGTLDANRTEQQANLFATVAKRAQEMLTGVETNISDARTGLGPQVTDEFEQVAQLVSGLAKSQGASSNDAMARLGQISNMAATERLAAPASLAAESKLALSDQEFNYKNQLQTALQEGLLNIGEEETAAIFNEAMRQENFNNTREQDMISALANDVFTKDARNYQSAEADIARGFQAAQAGESRAFQSEQNELNRQASKDAAAYSAVVNMQMQNDAQRFSKDERIASENYNDDIRGIEQAAAATAAEAQEAGIVAMSKYLDIPEIIYLNMTDQQKNEASKIKVERDILQGKGRLAAEPGSLQYMRDTSPGIEPEVFAHVEALIGIRADSGDEITGFDEAKFEKAKTKYLEDLQDTGTGGAYGINKADALVVESLFDQWAKADAIYKQQVQRQAAATEKEAAAVAREKARAENEAANRNRLTEFQNR